MRQPSSAVLLLRCCRADSPAICLQREKSGCVDRKREFVDGKRGFVDRKNGFVHGRSRFVDTSMPRLLDKPSAKRRDEFKVQTSLPGCLWTIAKTLPSLENSSPCFVL